MYAHNVYICMLARAGCKRARVRENLGRLYIKYTRARAKAAVAAARSSLYVCVCASNIQTVSANKSRIAVAVAASCTANYRALLDIYSRFFFSHSHSLLFFFLLHLVCRQRARASVRLSVAPLYVQSRRVCAV